MCSFQSYSCWNNFLFVLYLINALVALRQLVCVLDWSISEILWRPYRSWQVYTTGHYSFDIPGQGETLILTSVRHLMIQDLVLFVFRDSSGVFIIRILGIVASKKVHMGKQLLELSCKEQWYHVTCISVVTIYIHYATLCSN